MKNLTGQFALVLLSLGALQSTRIVDAKDYCKKGKEEARDLMEEYFENTLKLNCKKLDELEDYGGDLMDGKYKDKKGDDWKKEAKKKCARTAIRYYMSDIEDECEDFSPQECNDRGKTAASMIVNDFCAKYMYSLTYSSPLKEECREQATEKCQAHLYDAMEKFLDDHDECEGDEDPLGNWYSIEDELDDECEDIIDRWIG